MNTGFDSPVIIDSSTKAFPSQTIPSLGTISPTEHNTSSPGLRLLEVTITSFLPSPTNFLAETSLSRLLRESTRALASASESASEKVANQTVIINITATS